MRTLLSLAVPALAACAAAVGCAAKTDLPDRPVAPVEVDVRPVNFAALDAALKERKGHVVLVDFWATWCGPCVKKFPKLVERHQKYAPHGLVCVGVSFDPPGDRDRALAFLNDNRATFPNFLLTDRARDEDDIARRFGYAGGIPHLSLFDKGGERVWDSAREPRGDRAIDSLIESELKK